jgi:hypothetical protein
MILAIVLGVIVLLLVGRVLRGVTRLASGAAAGLDVLGRGLQQVTRGIEAATPPPPTLTNAEALGVLVLLCGIAAAMGHWLLGWF